MRMQGEEARLAHHLLGAVKRSVQGGIMGVITH
jgi:hypothetical protein